MSLFLVAVACVIVPSLCVSEEAKRGALQGDIEDCKLAVDDCTTPSGVCFPGGESCAELTSYYRQLFFSLYPPYATFSDSSNGLCNYFSAGYGCGNRDQVMAIEKDVAGDLESCSVGKCARSPGTSGVCLLSSSYSCEKYTEYMLRPSGAPMMLTSISGASSGECNYVCKPSYAYSSDKDQVLVQNDRESMNAVLLSGSHGELVEELSPLQWQFALFCVFIGVIIGFVGLKMIRKCTDGEKGVIAVGSAGPSAVYQSV